MSNYILLPKSEKVSWFVDLFNYENCSSMFVITFIKLVSIRNFYKYLYVFDDPLVRIIVFLYLLIISQITVIELEEFLVLLLWKKIKTVISLNVDAKHEINHWNDIYAVMTVMKNLELNSNKIKNKTHITKFLLKNKQKEGELKKVLKISLLV